MEDCISVVHHWLPESGQKLLSMTCRDYLQKYHSKDTLAGASIKCDDVDTYKKYCLKKEQHMELALEYRAWCVYYYLGGTIASRERFYELRETFSLIPSGMEEQELEYQRQICIKLGNQDMSAIWHERHKLVFMLNIILVEHGVRNMFYCDLFSRRYTEALLLLVDVPDELFVLGQLLMVCKRDYVFCLRDALREDVELGLAKCLNYGYTGADFKRKTNTYGVSFELYTKEGSCWNQLYGYRCPVEAYTDEVIEHNRERVTSINRVLMPLGYCVKVNIIKV